MSNIFDEFGDLPLELQKEALREGEKLLDAQFAAATAADQRALTWAGFLLTGATGALGGGIALFNTQKPDVWLGYLAIIFAAAILRSAWLALATVRPTLFCLPGNRPAHWLPSEWNCVGSAQAKVKTARKDQARHIDGFIVGNKEASAQRAAKMQRSFSWAFWTASIAGITLIATVTARNPSVQKLGDAASTAIIALKGRALQNRPYFPSLY